MQRYTFSRQGIPGDWCYLCNKNSNMYVDHQHPKQVEVNICPSCAGDIDSKRISEAQNRARTSK